MEFDWKVRIEKSIRYNGLRFYVMRFVSGYAEYLQSDGEIRKIKEGDFAEDLKPTFVISGFDARDMMKAIANALEEEGIKTNTTAKTEGTLEATKFHLSDLRQLLKLKNA